MGRIQLWSRLIGAHLPSCSVSRDYHRPDYQGLPRKQRRRMWTGPFLVGFEVLSMDILFYSALGPGIGKSIRFGNMALIQRLATGHAAARLTLPAPTLAGRASLCWRALRGALLTC